jgi:hypothetical protein
MDRFIKILRIVLIVFIITWVMIWYTGLALKKTERERNLIERALVAFSEAPELAKRYLKEKNDYLEKPILHDAQLGLLGNLKGVSCLNDTYYLLHYRYLGKNSGEVWLQNIINGEIAWRWIIPLKEVMGDVKSMDRDFTELFEKHNILTHFDHYISRNITDINIHSPIMTPDSGLIFNLVLGYAYKLDKNSNLLWKSEKLSHHSIELDQAGNVWTCSVDPDNAIAHHNGFRDDAILCLNPDGSEKHFYSLTDIFIHNNLFKRLIVSAQSLHEAGGYDPFHINDVLPVDRDGPYWKSGDLFISLRHQSMVALYRPDSDSIIWYQKGPWLTQHDINILNDSVISVFNNNAYFAGMLEKWSNIALYNFASGTTSFMADGVFNSHSNGRQTLIGNGSLIIEETDRSKYMVLDSAGKLQCKFYIPYYSDSTKAQYPGWSRVYMKSGEYFVEQ